MRKIAGDDLPSLWSGDDTRLSADATFISLNGGSAASQTDSVFTVPFYDTKSSTTGGAASSLNAGSNLLSATTLAGSSSETVAFANSGIVFVNTYTANVTQAYKNNILAAEQDIATHWSNSITLKLTFDAQARGTNTFLATNSWPSFVAVSYTALKNALTAHDASNPDAQAAVAAFPATDPNPAGGNDWNLPEAYARMLGLSQGAPATDDTILLNTSYSWAYGQDVIATIEHEITEGAMGRVGGLGDQNGVWSTMDLFRFSAVGVRDFTDGRDGKNTFFSVNGSQLLLQFNNEFSGPTKVNPNDTADYVVSDIFGTGSPGDTRTFSDTDLKNMNVLGWTPTDTTSPSLVHEGSITLAVGATATIPSSQLQFDDNVSTHAQETYSIVTAPAHGTLLKSGVATSSFTQADIDNGLISYHENGSVFSSDSFVFKVTDAAGNQTTAQQFQFQILSPDTTAPSLTHDSALTVALNGTSTITSSVLQFDDGTSTHAQEIYTIVTAPAHGTLLKSGAATSSFTQADIDNGLISYHEDGSLASSDTFAFKVTDAAGNATGTTSFQVNIGPLFAPATFQLAEFAPGAGGWSSDTTYPREFADLNKDGFADIVGFGQSGVYVALGTGTGSFGTPSFKLANFAPGAGGWSSDDKYPRELADVNKDGFADIVGFGESGVYVALGTGDGAFGTPSFKLANFAPGAGGWSSDDKYPRELADVNGDGMADIVGFGESGVYVALGTGGGAFGTPSFKLANFAPGAGGWSSEDKYPRFLADVNGDHMADIVGFGEGGVYVALATGGGSFGPASFRFAAFTPSAGGWINETTYPREVADVNNDGMADIVGFGQSGVYVALATGGGSFGAASFQLANFAPGAGGWSSDALYPRHLADLNHDGAADIVGFGQAGVYDALNGFHLT
jgi:hypothetical protein